MGYIDPMRGFTVSLIQHHSYINSDNQAIFIPELDETVISHKHVYSAAIGPVIVHMILDTRYNPKTMSFSVYEEVK